MNDANEQVVLVDASDQVIGAMGKWAAHTTGSLHRAFSVMLFDQAGDLLLQQRATVKYHSPNIWSNTCCGHPRPGEPTADAAARRLWEEMGLRVPLEEVFSFTYRAELGQGLIEHEVDHVFIGHCDQVPKPNPFEVQRTRYIARAALQAELEARPQMFSAWLPLCVWRAWDAYSQRLIAQRA